VFIVVASVFVIAVFWCCAFYRNIASKIFVSKLSIFPYFIGVLCGGGFKCLSRHEDLPLLEALESNDN